MAVYGGIQVPVEGLILAYDGGSERSYPKSGTSWFDLSGNNITATFNSAPTYRPNENALHFVSESSPTQYAEVTNLNSLKFTLGDFTIESWFKTEQSGKRQHLMGFGVVGVTPSIQFDMEDTGYGFWIFYDGGGAPNVRTLTHYNDGEWHQVVVTRSGSTITLYVDLVSKDTDTYATEFDLSSEAFVIAADDTTPAYFYSGSIGSVKVYNRALTDTERTQSYNQLKGRFL